MKRMLFAGAIALSAAVPAFAADLPAAPPPQAPAAYVPAVAPEYNWSGIYIGINGGYAFGDTDWNAQPGFVDTGSFSMNGILAGGTLGVNFQTSQFVFGIEGDGDWTDIKSGSVTCTVGACQTTNDWLATFRGRVGYAFDRVMIYATGGGAAGNIQANVSSAVAPATSGSTDTTEFGWTAGGGVEAALTDNITAKVEYLYVDLQNGNCSTLVCGTGTNVPVSFDANIVRAGLNFKFNPW